MDFLTFVTVKNKTIAKIKQPYAKTQQTVGSLVTKAIISLFYKTTVVPSCWELN